MPGVCGSIISKSDFYLDSVSLVIAIAIQLYQKFVVQIASLSRVYVSSSAPQSERIVPLVGISYDENEGQFSS
jgi:hypothetical protein